eukprot:14107157-Alexandrium_andersonii.AAC.1
MLEFALEDELLRGFPEGLLEVEQVAEGRMKTTIDFHSFAPPVLQSGQQRVWPPPWSSSSGGWSPR